MLRVAAKLRPILVALGMLAVASSLWLFLRPAPSLQAQVPTPTATSVNLPDLVVLSMSIELETGGACDFTSTELGVRIVIGNIGSADAGPFVVDVNGAQQTVTSGLAEGETVSLWFAGHTPGFGENTAFADATSQVEESNEANNQVSAVVPIPTLPPPCTPTPTPTATPTPTPPLFVVTNDTGEPAGFLHLQSVPSFSALPAVSPPGCGAPTVAFGFEYWEVTWPSPCVDPGESVVFDLPPFVNVFSHYWAPSPPVISAVNDTGLLADGLTITAGVFIKGATVIENAPGCPAPTFGFATFGQLDVFWSSACVDPGEKVSIHLGTLGPVTSAPYAWSTVAPPPTPTPIGGIGVIPEISAPRAGSTDATAGGNGGVVAGVVATVTAAVLALGGAAWYARRRRLR